MTNTHVSANKPDHIRDDEFIRRAIEQSNLNALRLALYLQTGDPELAAMQTELRPARGGSMFFRVVAPQDVPALKQKAFVYLKRPAIEAVPPPAQAETERLLGIFGTPPTTPAAARLAFEELAFEDAPRRVVWRTPPAADVLERYKVTIVGAGISGLAAAISLKQLGIPFEIIERQAGVGGTWRLNDYPEARVDISNFVYQYKFEKNYPWRGSFADQSELKAYLEFIANKYELMGHIRLNTELVSAKWDDEFQQWILDIRATNGTLETLRTKIVLSASGLFSTPNLPDIAGIETFGGKMFHTTMWDHSFDFSGKRVALIGTGSTGAQLMPRLARDAEKLWVFQRTPNWIMPVEGYHARVSEEQRYLLDTLPYYWNWFCYSNFLADSEIQQLQVFDSAWRATGGMVSERNDKLRAFLERNLQRKIGHRPDLVTKCLPSYPPAARRLVIDNGWFDALLQPNVELVNEAIERITKDGIVLRNGDFCQVDLIVLSSGFKTSRYLWPTKYVGRDGRTPEDLWAADGARAYLGATMPGFPNFFMFYGPNGQFRAGSFHGWAEVCARYAIKLIVSLVENNADSFDVREQVYRDYNAQLDEEMAKLIWGFQGAGSYYLNEKGRSGVNMPWTVEEFFGRVMEPDLRDYDFATATSVS